VASAAAEPEPVAAQAEAAEEMNLVQPSKALPGEAELAARKGTWRYEGNSATT
jgi:NADH-quinone oxidoreductase subunit E